MREHQYTTEFCALMNLLDPRVHLDTKDFPYECAWVAPYGFVIEAGCPRHD